MSWCSWDDCNKDSVGKSKYCQEHKQAAKAAWIAHIREGANEREIRNAKFATLWKEACEKAEQASSSANPHPEGGKYIVQEHINPLDDSSPVTQQWEMPNGLCGFAWIMIRPGNCAFANWLKKNTEHKYSDYHKGVMIFMHHGNQSIVRKEAAASAMAKVFHQNDIECSVYSRLD